MLAAGDCAAVPDLTGPPARSRAPNAQHAVRQAKVLGDNVVRSLRGEPLKDYEHKYVGSVASLGLHKGVAQVYGIKLQGLARLVHAPDLPREPVPTFNRKVRVIADWTLALFFRRDVVSLGRCSTRATTSTAPTSSAVPRSDPTLTLLWRRPASDLSWA